MAGVYLVALLVRGLIARGSAPARRTSWPTSLTAASAWTVLYRVLEAAAPRSGPAALALAAALPRHRPRRPARAAAADRAAGARRRWGWPPRS